jgi:hypothetical protein
MLDFEAVYFGSRCLLEHHDPYQESEFQRVFEIEKGETIDSPLGRICVRKGVVKCINLPTSLFLLAPMALLQWGPAHLTWMILTASILTLAAILTWSFAANWLNGIPLFLTCFLLINSKVVTSFGNLSGIAVGLCVIATWCILKERFAWAGVLCMALSLMLKPHTAGGVWLFFLLAGAGFRKRALQALALTAVLGVPAIVWVGQVSPHWPSEWNSNISASETESGINNPHARVVEGYNPFSIIDLQTVTSIFVDSPKSYNGVAYAICFPLLLVWVVVTLRKHPSQAEALLGIAAIAALSMLPLYHRMYDAKLLLLAVPACAMLVAEGGVTGRIALLLTTASFVAIADIPIVTFTYFTQNIHITPTDAGGKLLTVLVRQYVPILLLLLGVFYLWVYMRRTWNAVRSRREDELVEKLMKPDLSSI